MLEVIYKLIYKNKNIMLEVKINDDIFFLKQEPSDFTIGEYEDVVSILKNEEYDQFDRYYNLFSSLGIPTELLDEFDVFNFKDLITEYNSKFVDSEMVNEITIDGRTFKSYDTEFKLSVKQMKTAIEFIKVNDIRCMAEILSIIFHETNKTREENWLKSNIIERTDLFRNKMTADIANPYFMFLIKKVFINGNT